MQPKLPPDLARFLHHAGFRASCYQPVSMFPKDGRKLPNVACATDPWQCFLRRGDSPWVETMAVGPTLREAVEQAIVQMLPAGGLRDAMSRLETEFYRLATVIHASQG